MGEKTYKNLMQEVGESNVSLGFSRIGRRVAIKIEHAIETARAKPARVNLGVPRIAF